MGEDHNGGRRSPRCNADVVRQVIEEIWNQGNLEVADTLFSAAYVNAGGLVPDLVRGPEAIKIAAALHHTAFPRLHVTIERLIAEGPHVAFQWVARSHAMDDEATPNLSTSPGTLRGTTFCRLVAGKIDASWTNWDASGLLQTLIRARDVGPRRAALVPVA